MSPSKRPNLLNLYKGLIRVILDTGQPVVVFTESFKRDELCLDLEDEERVNFVETAIGGIDIWIKDFFPVSLGSNKLLSGVYAPSYLDNDYKKYIRNYVPLVSYYFDCVLSQLMPITLHCMNLTFDGGSVVCTPLNGGTLFVSNRVFGENEQFVVTTVENMFAGTLNEQFQVVFVPPYDYHFGHIDDSILYVPYKDCVITTSPYVHERFKDKVIFLDMGMDFSTERYARNIPLNCVVCDECCIIPDDFTSPHIREKVEESFRSLGIETIFFNKDIAKLHELGGSLGCITWRFLGKCPL